MWEAYLHAVQQLFSTTTTLSVVKTGKRFKDE